MLPENGRRKRDLTMPSEKTVERISRYRYLLYGLKAEGVSHIFSHALAEMAAVSAAQVRQDMMVVGYSGTPVQGYEVEKLLAALEEFLEVPEGKDVALVGVGNLGLTILKSLVEYPTPLRLSVAFDVDWRLVNRQVQGCWCYPVDQLVPVVRERQIPIGIIAVPPKAAQEVADLLCAGGVTGILNCAPLRLRVPEHVYVSNLNMMVALEKVSYFAHRSRMRLEHPGKERMKA